MLLSRDQFREAVFERDNHKCIICQEPAQDAHHIMERRLFEDSGYYLNNGASLCGIHHLLAEQTILTTQYIRDVLKISKPILPENYYDDNEYDKWGNIILPNGRRLRGELFYDESVQRVIKPVLDQFTKHVKYPRTYHLPWSNGTDDDRFLKSDINFKLKDVVVTEKLDGENTTMYNDYIHARSLEYDSHQSRSFIKKFHSGICYNIPEDYRICCENVTAVHSIEYKEKLKHFCFGFSVWLNDMCLSWDNTIEWFELLNVEPVPVIYRGTYDVFKIQDAYEKIKKEREIEGYVVRIADSFNFRDFKNSIGKYVRKNHVSSENHHWKFKKVVYNNFGKDII